MPLYVVPQAYTGMHSSLGVDGETPGDFFEEATHAKVLA